MGFVLTIVGLCKSLRLNPSDNLRRRINLASRILLSLIVVITVWPYWWLDIWTRWNGERPGNEGEGVFGFLIMILFGFPSLLLAILNEIRLCSKSKSPSQSA